MNHRDFPADLCKDILIVVFDLLHLGAFAAVAVNDAVAAEIRIMRPVAEIAAIEVGFPIITILHPNALIDEIPDKAALVKRFLIGILGVFMQRAI